jgi:two-component system CheB/CheR fusion protein
VLTGERVQYEKEMQFDGIGARWISAVYTPTFDAAGLPDGWVSVAIDIDRRKRTEEALREADRRKDEFLAVLAHELRNPLAPIQNAVDILASQDTDEDARQWSREVIERQVRQMARLLDDLLDVSRITRDKLSLRRQQVTLAAVVEAALETSRPLIEAGGQTLEVTLPDASVPLDADPIRLAQVFANLLNNAAKYTDRGGWIRLTGARQGEEVTLSVRDSGIGIAPEMQPRLFEIFSQATPALERSQGGLGIGLSLARGLVEMHGGSVAVHSDGLGKGSEFVVRLPVAAPLPETPPLPAAALPADAPPGRRVLIADDNRDAAESLAMILELLGYEVRTAGDGEEAVAAAAAFQPHAIVLDIGMPRLDGYGAARRIRAQPWGRATVLVALSGWGQEEDQRRSREAGFDEHLVKPAAPTALDALLRRLTSRPPAA